MTSPIVLGRGPDEVLGVATVGPEVVVQPLLPFADMSVGPQASARQVITSIRDAVSEPETPGATDVGGVLIVSEDIGGPRETEGTVVQPTVRPPQVLPIPVYIKGTKLKENCGEKGTAQNTDDRNHKTNTLRHRETDSEGYEDSTC